jgi:hypothetical protein
VFVCARARVCVCVISVFKSIFIATCSGLLVIFSKEKAKDIFLTVTLVLYSKKKLKNGLLFRDPLETLF